MRTNIITRAEWGARRRKGTAEKVAPEKRTATMVHYSTGEELGREDTYEWVRQIQAHHMDANGWSDIGYNFLVDREGRIFEGRGWDVIGAHCADYNTPAVGVCFLGDDDPGQDVPDVARFAILELHAEHEARAGHDLERLGHRDKFATACPGDELYGWFTADEAPTAPTPAPPHRPSRTGNSTRRVAPAFPLAPGRYFGRGGVTHSRYIGQWQRRMIARGWKFPKYGPDSSWGAETEGVLRAFQAEKGLHVDGKLGPVSWAAAWLAPTANGERWIR